VLTRGRSRFGQVHRCPANSSKRARHPGNAQFRRIIAAKCQVSCIFASPWPKRTGACTLAKATRFD